MGVLTIGLSYKFFLKDGKSIQVDAEENIGQIEYPNDIKVNDWLFNVELNVLEVTGLSSQERTERTMEPERKPRVTALIEWIREKNSQFIILMLIISITRSWI